MSFDWNWKEYFETKVRAGDFIMPEDRFHALAEHFGVDVVEAAPTPGDTSGGGTPVESEDVESPDKAEEVVESPDKAEEVVEDGYDTWVKDDLEDELRARELPVSGTKDELIQRLEDADKGGNDG